VPGGRGWSAHDANVAEGVTAGLGPSSNVSASVLADAVCLTVGPNNSAEGPTAPQVAIPAAALAGKMNGQGFNTPPMQLIFARPCLAFQPVFSRAVSRSLINPFSGFGKAALGGSPHPAPSTPCFSLAPALALDAAPSRLSQFSPCGPLPRPLIRGHFYRGGKGTLSSRFNRKPTLVLVPSGQGHKGRRKYK